MSTVYPGQYEIWIADLDPSFGSEPGKTRPVVILQSNILNNAGHSSLIICPVSSQHKEGISLLRLDVAPTISNGLARESYILCDQLRAIDVLRLKDRVGVLSAEVISRLNESIKVILAL
jgi:mRNA interferase MazF